MPTAKCNCDITDGKLRRDFGLIIDKGDLPIVKITLNDIGPDQKGSYTIGALECAQRQFGNFSYKHYT